MFASVNLAVIGLDNVLPHFLRQAILRTNAGLLLIRLLGMYFSEILIELQNCIWKI